MEKVGEIILHNLRATRNLALIFNEKLFPKPNRSQVWVETVIYTLIALTIIGLFLSFAKPKIEEIQDKSVVEQSVEMLEEINSIILNIIQGGAGNKRVIDVSIKKGTLTIDGVQDTVKFELEGRYTYTQPGEDGQPGDFLEIGRVLASTQKKGKDSIVTLISNYSGSYNITYQGSDSIKAVSKAPIAYRISIENAGDASGTPIINFKVQ